MSPEKVGRTSFSIIENIDFNTGVTFEIVEDKKGDVTLREALERVKRSLWHGVTVMFAGEQVFVRSLGLNTYAFVHNGRVYEEIIDNQYDELANELANAIALIVEHS